jgi:hypothetical protein
MKIAILWVTCLLGSATAFVDAAPSDAASTAPANIEAEFAALSSLEARSSPETRVVDQPNALLRALKQNDFAALVVDGGLSNDLDETAREWNERARHQREALAKRAADEHRDVPAADAVLMDVLDKLRSDEGVELLVAEWQPKVAEESGKLITQFNLAFGALLSGIAADQELPFERAQQLTDLLRAVQAWTARTDFADRERLRRSLTALSRVVRQTGAKNFDELLVLSFEDMAVHGESFLIAVKQILADYGVPADEILESVRFSEHEAKGDRAVLRIDASVLGVALTHEVDMRYYGGTWIPAEVADEMQKTFGELEQQSPEAHRQATPEMPAEATPETGKHLEVPATGSSPSLGCKRQET